MFTTILFLWTAVACTKSNCTHDWRPIGQFDTPALCEQAKRDLGIDQSNRARCVRSVGKEARHG